MSDKELLELILKTIEDKKLTAYEISKETGVSTFAIGKILKRETANPNKNTLLKILKYLENNLPGTNLPADQVNEPNSTYFNPDKIADYVIENTDELLKNEKFAMWYQSIVLKTENELLKSLTGK